MKLSEAAEILKLAGIEDAKREALELFAVFSEISKSRMLTEDVSSDSEKLRSAIERRAKREPLQYILGKTYFYNEEYVINEGCLIPRADTEILVEYACNHIPKGERFLDLCSGSGCVGISTLKNTDSTYAVLADISEAAIEISKKNAALNGVADRIEFVACDVMSEVVNGEYFAVLSNPPYVAESVYRELAAEIFHEPEIAFVGGKDGMDFYQRLIPIYKEKISKEGFMAFEIGFDQAEKICEIANTVAMRCSIIKDLSGNDRVAVLTF